MNAITVQGWISGIVRVLDKIPCGISASSLHSELKFLPVTIGPLLAEIRDFGI